MTRCHQSAGTPRLRHLVEILKVHWKDREWDDDLWCWWNSWYWAYIGRFKPQPHWKPHKFCFLCEWVGRIVVDRIKNLKTHAKRRWNF